jgi:hypothetical protein
MAAYFDAQTTSYVRSKLFEGPIPLDDEWGEA